MGSIGQQITVVIMAIVGVAVLSVILSKQANTSNVIGAAGSGFSQLLSAAISPVAGNSGLNY